MSDDATAIELTPELASMLGLDEPAPTTPPEEGPPTEQSAPQSVAPAAPPSEAVAPPRQEEGAPVPEPPAPTPAAQPRQPTREEVLARRSELLKLISDSYRLSPQEAEALSVNPAEVLPNMAARLYLDVYETIYSVIVGQLPQLISSLLASHDQARTLRERFFERWPQLRDPKYHPVIQRIESAYRTVNPNASPEDFIREVGAQAVLALGLYKKPQARPFSPAPSAGPVAPQGPKPSPEEELLLDLMKEA